MSNALTRIPSVPVLKRPDVAIWTLVAVLPVAGYAARTFQATRTIVQVKTHRVSVQEQLGKPAQSLAGEQVNPALKGLVCDVYQRGPVILCHR